MNGCGCESGSKSHSWLPRAPIVRTPLTHKHRPAADITVSRCNLCLALADWGVGRRANSLAEEFRFLASRRRRNKSTCASDSHRRERRPHVAASKRAFFAPSCSCADFFGSREVYLGCDAISGSIPRGEGPALYSSGAPGGGKKQEGKKGFFEQRRDKGGSQGQVSRPGQLNTECDPSTRAHPWERGM